MTEDERFVPRPGVWSVASGVAELIADADRPGGFLLAVDGVAQSYVDLVDPTYLEFAYVRHLAAVLAPVLAASTGAEDVVHIGGGAGTLARHLAAAPCARPQVVVDVDGLLAAGIRERLGVAGFTLEVGDGREVVAARSSGSAAAVVTDAFTGPHVPSHLTTVEYLADVRRVLGPGGVHAMNVADAHPFDYGRRLTAGLLETFASVLVVVEPAVLRGRRFGNLVLMAGNGHLPVAEIARRVAGDAVAPARVMAGAHLHDWVAGAPPFTDDRPVDSPIPPPGVFTIR
jgi:spermidine synthase